MRDLNGLYPPFGSRPEMSGQFGGQAKLPAPLRAGSGRTAEWFAARNKRTYVRNPSWANQSSSSMGQNLGQFLGGMGGNFSGADLGRFLGGGGLSPSRRYGGF